MVERDYVEKDYYQVLGVPKDADQAAIAKAYRKLARQLHPDARPEDTTAEQRFKEVGEAYAVLSKPDKRKEYDQVREMVASGAFRHADASGFPGGGFPRGGFAGGGFAGGGFGPADGQAFDAEDLLGGLFGQPGTTTFAGGGQRRGQRRRRGRDLSAELTLSFDDAMAGATKTLRIPRRATCSVCAGSGAAPGTSPVTCPSCGGTGRLARDQGLFGLSEPCSACGGSGRQIPTPCPSCGGAGIEMRERTVRARIPAGVRDGARIRLKGKGEPGRSGGAAGDLYVTVHVQPDELFGREGDDLTLRVPVSFTEAALGTRLKVPTPEDPVTVRIPAGTQSGQTLRVRGKGAPKPGGGRGDLLVTVEVAVPRNPSQSQRELLEQLAATEPGDLRAHLERRLRVKEAV